MSKDSNTSEVNYSDKQAVCLVENKQIRKKLRRALRGTGIQWAESIEDITTTSIVFVDSIHKFEDIKSLAVAQENGQVVILGQSIGDGDILSLMNQSAMNHVISAGSEYDEGELLATSVKITSGDIFGIEKYLRWGAKIHEQSVSNYEEKKLAIDFVEKLAKELGIRRSLLAKIQTVTDELLMNAIYDAPKAAKERNLDASNVSANIRVASDGCFFAVAVTDHFGLLEKKIILDHLTKAKTSGGQPRLQGDSGAGLGLYFVISSCSRFVANIQRGKKSEIICLFDMRLTPQQTTSCADSLHIFMKS